MLKSLENRQLGKLDEGRFVSEQTNRRLTKMTFSTILSHSIAGKIRVLETSHDYELLLAASTDELGIFRCKNEASEQDTTLKCLGRGSFGRENSSLVPPPFSKVPLCLNWCKFDNNMVTKSGGRGTIQIWDVNNLNGPRDSSPRFGTKDYRKYSYHSADSRNLCVLAGLQHDAGINILDLRVGLDTPLMHIKARPRLGGGGRILNLAFNPALEQQLYVLEHVTPPYKPTSYQISQYDTRSSNKSLNSFELPIHVRSPLGTHTVESNRIPLTFSGDGQRLYTVMVGDLFELDPLGDGLWRRLRVLQNNDFIRGKFQLTYHSSPELLFLPFGRSLKIYDLAELKEIAELPLQTPSLVSNFPIAVDPIRQMAYVADRHEMQLYATMPPNDCNEV